MTSNQDGARRSFEDLIASKGIKVRHIAKVVGVHEASLSHWRAGSRNLAGPVLMRLGRYLLTKKVR